MVVLQQTVNLFPCGKHWRFNSSLPHSGWNYAGCVQLVYGSGWICQCARAVKGAALKVVGQKWLVGSNPTIGVGLGSAWDKQALR